MSQYVCVLAPGECGSEPVLGRGVGVHVQCVNMQPASPVALISVGTWQLSVLAFNML